MRQGFLLCTDRALEVVAQTQRAFLALVRHAEPNPGTGQGLAQQQGQGQGQGSSCAGLALISSDINIKNDNNKTITTTTTTTTSLPRRYLFDFEECGVALSACDKSLALLLALVAQQSASLKSVVHEPVILSPPFPVAEHAALLDQFRQVTEPFLLLSAHSTLPHSVRQRIRTAHPLMI